MAREFETNADVWSSKYQWPVKSCSYWLTFHELEISFTEGVEKSINNNSSFLDVSDQENQMHGDMQVWKKLKWRRLLKFNMNSPPQVWHVQKLTEQAFCDVWMQPEPSDFTQQPVSFSILLSSSSTLLRLSSSRIQGANLAPILIKPACRRLDRKQCETCQNTRNTWKFRVIAVERTATAVTRKAWENPGLNVN